MQTPAAPEKPRHIDDRVAHLTTPDLIAAFGDPAGVHDIASLRRYVATTARTPAWPLPLWADAVRGSAEAETTLADADPLLQGVDVTGAGLGRSRLYGFHYLRWLAPGVAAWLLTGRQPYLDAFGRHLVAWADARDGVRGAWPGLDVIWYSLGTWARCSNLLPALHATTDSALDDTAWAVMLATLVGGARWAYDEHDAFRHGNWQLASATQLMQIGAVLPGLTEAAGWRERGRERVDEHLLLDVYPDGGHYERSPGYHAMCLQALQVAAAVDLRHGDGSLAAHPRLRAMHTWLSALADDAGWVPHLQDSGIVWPAELMLAGGYLLQDAELVRRARQWLPSDVWPRRLAALPAWDEPDRQQCWENLIAHSADQPAAPPPPRVVLPHSGYTMLRSGPAPESLRMVINHGPHIEHELESHSHHAALDMVLTWRGRPLLWEAGGPPSYDDEEYLTWFQSGRGHNTVMVDDTELGDDRTVEVAGLVDAGPLTAWTGTCRSGGRHHLRELIMVREAPYVVLMRDRVDLASAGRHRFGLHLHALAPWTREPNGAHLTLTGDTGLRVIDLEADAATTVTYEQGRARIPDAAAREATYGPLHSLVLTRPQGRFRTLLLPVSPDATTTASADAGTVVIEHTSGDGVTLDRIGPHSWVRTRPGSPGRLLWAAGWGATRLDVDGLGRIETSVPCDLTVHDDREAGPTLRVDTPSRGTVRLLPDGRTRAGRADAVLDGVKVPCRREADGAVTVGLPYAGRWTIGDRGHHG